MDNFKGYFQVAPAWFLLILSAYQAATSLIYMIKMHKSSKRLENVLVLLCNIFLIPCTISYFLITMNYQRENSLLLSSSLCKSSTFILKSVVIVNKFVYILILAFRYMVLKQSKDENENDRLIARRSFRLVAGTFVILLFQAIFDHTYTSCINDEKEHFCSRNDFSKHLVYNLVTTGCFFVAIVLQTVILVLTIRPSDDQPENNQRKSILKKNSRRNVLCTLVIYLNDLGLIVVQLMMSFVKIPMTVVLLTNIVLNCVTLTFSFEDYRERIFSFILLKPDKVFERQIVKSITVKDHALLKPESFKLKVLHTYRKPSKRYRNIVT